MASLDLVAFVLLLCDQSNHNRFFGLPNAATGFQGISALIAIVVVLRTPKLNAAMLGMEEYEFANGDARSFRAAFLLCNAMLTTISLFLNALDVAKSHHINEITIGATVLQMLIGAISFGIGVQQLCGERAEQLLLHPPPPEYVRVRNV